MVSDIHFWCGCLHKCLTPLRILCLFNSPLFIALLYHTNILRDANKEKEREANFEWTNLHPLRRYRSILFVFKPKETLSIQ